MHGLDSLVTIVFVAQEKACQTRFLSITGLRPSNFLRISVLHAQGWTIGIVHHAGGLLLGLGQSFNIDWQVILL